MNGKPHIHPDPLRCGCDHCLDLLRVWAERDRQSVPATPATSSEHVRTDLDEDEEP